MNSPAAAPTAARNPGPSWGYACMRLWDRFVPEVIYLPCRAIGTWIALANMPAQRRHSRAYLRVVLGRDPSLIEVFRHFLTFGEVLMLKLRVAQGRSHRGVLAPGSEDFRQLINSGEDALLGTFHFGHSDLVGFLFGGQEKRRVSMVRQRVGNSSDVDKLGQLFGHWVSFVWINEGDNLLFALKDALATGGSLALKCDRLEFSARTEVFNFLGARRIFPFTIYYLALIFNRPVILSVGVPGEPGESLIHSAPRWAPDPALSRAANLASARVHFQGFLTLVETLIRQNPYWWFNFLELNPEAPSASA
jgi:predicted LPLAT superfamily acyltransferase